MKKIFILRTFLPISFLIQLSQSFSCNETKDCFCYNNSIEFEFQCPSDPERYSMFVKPGHILKIECSSSILEYSTDTLPDISVENLEQFVLKYCPLPEIDFQETLLKFNITSIKEMLILGDHARRTVYNVSQELFQGVHMLEKLTISLGQATFEANFLSKLSNLVRLNLASNKIESIDSNLLKHTPKLRFLDLSRNLLTDLPYGAFQNLQDLQSLHLWNNKLTTLDKTVFLGLEKLTSLELSRNQITHLEEITFSRLTELSSISLSSNNLSYIASNTFRNNTALNSIRIGRNTNLNLSNYIFSNLHNLTDINIDSSNLELIPEHLFRNSTNLLVISLSVNDIKMLPRHVFKDLISLKILNLSKNKLSSLPSGIFDTLENLEQLNLEQNRFSKIGDMEFRNTVNLKVLNLRYNALDGIDINAFLNLDKLVELDLSHNQYNLSYGDELTGINPFGRCINLEKLRLSYNLIRHFPTGILETGINLKQLHLDHNKIEYLSVTSLLSTSKNQVFVDMEYNEVSIVEFLGMDNTVTANMKLSNGMNFSSTVVHISHNPLRCDCANFHLIQYKEEKLNPGIKKMVEINMDRLFCSTPSTFNHTLVKNLAAEDIKCLLDDQGCPTGCLCQLRPVDQTAIVDCAGRNLTEPPPMYLTIKKLSPLTSDLDQPLVGLKNIELHLEDNLLTTPSFNNLGYDNVTKLYLSNNLLTTLDTIPPKIKVLALDGNRLQNLNTVTLNQSVLENVTLSRNPWKCDCFSSNLQAYLIEHYTKIRAYDVICEDSEPLIEKTVLCVSHTATAIAILVPLLILMSITALLAALYFYYQVQIKTWLYAKNLCLWFVTEEELDKHKTYDVFLSYSHKDEQFVEEELLPKLEAGPEPFKVCIHVRDWLPGEFITTQVVRSVLDSKRTLVVLSENFLESVWGKMEFRTAHTQAVEEGRAKVIVIKYGELKDEVMDEEVRSYLRTNTYVEWGDPWFWDKLRFALPHSRVSRCVKTTRKRITTSEEVTCV